jgi:hypothetical protein
VYPNRASQGPLFDQVSRSDRRHCQKFHYLAS